MRIIERMCLYAVVAFLAVSVLERATADDEAKEAAETLRARNLELVGAGGKVALRLSATAHGGTIEIRNKDGQTVVNLMARADKDGEIRLYDESGTYRANIGGDRTGGYVNVMGPKKGTAAYIGSDSATGGGYAAIYAANGKKGAEIVANKRGALFATTNVQTGERTGAFGTADDVGDGFLALAAKSGKARAILFGLEGGGRLSIADKAGETVAQLGTNAKGASLELLNSETKRSVAVLGTASDTGTGLLALNRPDGKLGMALYTSQHGGQMNVLNGDGKKAAFIGVSANPAGNGLMYVARTDGQRLFESGATASAGGYMSVRNHRGERVLFIGASGGQSKGDGVVEVSRRGGKLGVVLRAFQGGSSLRVYDAEGKVKTQVR